MANRVDLQKIQKEFENEHQEFHEIFKEETKKIKAMIKK